MIRVAKLFLTQAVFLAALLGTSLQCTSADEATNKRLASASQLVSQMTKDVEAILVQDPNNTAIRIEQVTTLFDRYFDLPNLTKFSAGPYWRQANSAEKEAYTEVMRDVIISTVVRNFDRLDEYKFKPLSTQAKGNQLVLVSGEFVNKNNSQSAIAVAWRVITRDNKPPLILDVEIENISMLVTQKQENIAIIRKNEGKFAALIDAMRRRNQPQS
jgi:phospholipid transport system substrate-binding protein